MILVQVAIRSKDISQLELGYLNIGLSTFTYDKTAVSQGIVVHVFMVWNKLSRPLYNGFYMVQLSSM